MIRDSLTKRLPGIAGTAVVAMGMAACGGANNTSTATPPDTETSVVAATPAPTSANDFTVTGNTYTFSNKGYAVNAPDGWSPRLNIAFDVAGARFPMDAWVLQDAENAGVQPRISISCLKPRDDQATAEQFRDGWKAFLAQLQRTDVVQTVSTIAGQPAFIFNYGQSQESDSSPAADRTDAVFVAGACRWMITLVAPVGQQATYSDAFQQVTSSFHLLIN